MAAKYEPIKLNDSVRLQCNQCLSDLQGLLADVDKADAAGITGIDAMRQRCQSCVEKFSAIKSTYFPNKK